MSKIAYILITITLAMAALTGCAADSALPQTEPKPNPPQVDPVLQQLNEMTLEEKIGQMLVAGVEGVEISEKEMKLIKDYHIGGFILFGKNIESPEQLIKLTNSLKKANASNTVPIFVSIDEEGGRISRIPEEVAGLPTSKQVGKQKDEELSYEIGLRLAEKVRAFGFNMDFAPVLDINSNPRNPVIGDRAFGADAEWVSRLGVQTMLGIKAGEIIPVVKHFPGHGDTSVDSHIGLPVVDSGLERLEAFEFRPFINAIDNKAPCIMVAHILVSKLDNDYPATLSHRIIGEVLRSKLGFDGVVITDDMTMGAITKNYDLANAVLQAVKAGNDIILMAHRYENAKLAFDAIHKAVRDKSIAEERINQSVYRILKLKHQFALQDNEIHSLDIAGLNNSINNTLKKLK